MLADPAFDEPAGGNAWRRGALWEARPTLAAVLTTPLMVALVLSPFWGVALFFLFDPAGENAVATLRIGGVPIDLGPDGERQAHYALIAVFLLWPLILVGSALIRKMRLHYRLDAQGIESWRGATLVRRIDIADICRVRERSYLVWRDVRIDHSPKHEIALQLGSADARQLRKLLQVLGVDPEEPLAVVIPEVAPTEPVRWQGRPGFAALDKFQLALAPVLLVPFAIYLWPLVWFWSSGVPLVGCLLALAIWTPIWGGLAVMSLGLLGTVFAAWLNLAFGMVLVTDRRIAWREWGSGDIFRELALSELIDAVIVERKGRRAWVALTIRRGSDNVREEDLRGIPDAERFVKALGFGA